MTTVRELLTKIGFEVDTSQLKNADVAINSMKSSLKDLSIVATSATAAIFGIVKSSATFSDNIISNAKDIGVTTDQLQKLSYAAEHSGATTEDLVSALRRLEFGIGDAFKTGNANEMTDTLERMNIKVYEIVDGAKKLRSVHDVLLDIANGLKGKSAIEQQNFSRTIFGRGGALTTRFLAQGADAIRQLEDRASSLNLVLSKESLEAGEKFEHSWTDIKSVLKATKNIIGVGLAPAMTDITNKILEWSVANKKLIQDNITNFLQSLTSMLHVLWSAASLVSDAFSALAVIVGGTSNAIKIMIGVFVGLKVYILLKGIWALSLGFRSLALSVLDVDLAMLAVPIAIGLVVAAISYLILKIMDFFGVTDDLLGKAEDKWTHFAQIFVDVGIGTAIAAWVVGLEAFVGAIRYAVIWLAYFSVGFIAATAPFWVIVGVIGLITYAVYKLIETLNEIDWGLLGKAFDAAWRKLLDLAVDGIYNLVALIIDGISAAVDYIKEKWNSLISFFSDFVNKIEAFFESITWDNFADKAIEAFKAVEKYLMGPFWGSVIFIIDSFKTLYNLMNKTSEIPNRQKQSAALDYTENARPRSESRLEQESGFFNRVVSLMNPVYGLITKAAPSVISTMQSSYNMPTYQPASSQLARNGDTFHRNNNIQLHNNVTVNVPNVSSTLDSNQVAAATKKALEESLDSWANQALWNNTVLE